MPKPKRQAGSTERPEAAETTQVRIVVDRPEDIPALYTNHVEVTFTPWDFVFKFCEVVGFDDEAVRARERGRVGMSPQHMKALHSLIGRQLAKYEDAYGEIPDLERVMATRKEGKEAN